MGRGAVVRANINGVEFTQLGHALYQAVEDALAADTIPRRADPFVQIEHVDALLATTLLMGLESADLAHMQQLVLNHITGSRGDLYDMAVVVRALPDLREIYVENSPLLLELVLETPCAIRHTLRKITLFNSPRFHADVFWTSACALTHLESVSLVRCPAIVTGDWPKITLAPHGICVDGASSPKTSRFSPDYGDVLQQVSPFRGCIARLRRVELARCGPLDETTFTALLAEVHAAPHLSELVLTHMRLGNDRIVRIADMLMLAEAAPNLALLDVRHNPFDEHALRDLVVVVLIRRETAEKQSSGARCALEAVDWTSGAISPRSTLYNDLQKLRLVVNQPDTIEVMPESLNVSAASVSSVRDARICAVQSQ